MTTGTDNKKSALFWTTLFFVVLIGAGIWLLSKIGSVVGYFVVAGAIAYILNPAIEVMCRKKIPRGLAILFIFLVFTGIMTAAVIFVIPPAIKQFNDLVDNLPRMFEAVRGLWDKAVKLSKDSAIPVRLEDLPEKLAGDMQRIVSNAGKSIFSGIAGFFSAAASLIIVPILVYYFLKDSRNIRGAFLSYVPPAYRDETGEVLTKINNALGGFVRGQLKLCLVMGLLTWLTLGIILHLKYALVFGVIAAVTEFIPYLGPILALIGPLVYATTISWAMVAKVLVLFVIIQLLEGNVLAPRIIGKDVDMHPAFIIMVLMAGGQVAGIIGMIAALPVAVIMKVFFEHFYVQKFIIPAEKGEGS